MHPLAVTQSRFDGVPEGVAEVEDGPQSGFALVLFYHPGLELAAAFDGISQNCRIARHQTAEIGLDPVEKPHVGNRSVLDDLRQAGAELARRQRTQGVEVADHPLRLVESANHVFSSRMVDGRFPTN